VPTYNRASLITETIDSILRQSYPNFEVLVVDDGSKDNTNIVVEKLVQKDSRVRYFFKENEERGIARNFGLNHSNGDYAVFFDSDDIMGIDYLKTFHEKLVKNPEIKFIATKYNYFNSATKFQIAEFKVMGEGFYNRNFFLKGNTLACMYCINIQTPWYQPFPVKREIAFLEDWLFLLKNLETTDLFLINEEHCSMRLHEGNSTANNSVVVNTFKEARIWGLENLSLNKNEKAAFVAWSHYFCGVHYFIDNKNFNAIKQSLCAIQIGGFNLKFLILLVKSIIGRKFLLMLGIGQSNQR
jgi:glycosyltransferase involved in cell wall biosynthesis